MLTFKQFILEYLTDKQREHFSQYKMTDKARSDTDHFFGKDNDIVHEPLKFLEHEKSETHKKVEDHLGHPISYDEYKSGKIKDKHGRDVRIGKSIKDPKLQQEYSNDNARAGTKKSSNNHHVSIVRGTEVAGQTNPETDEKHPTGHSWSERDGKKGSCKDLNTGCNRHFIPNEIKHGTVVTRIHDHDGKEIYRATHQPHHNDEGHVAYNVESEYGIKHPSFTKHAHDVASRLSGEHKGGSMMYRKHGHVYNDNGAVGMLHHNATHEHISKALNDKDHGVRDIAIQHPNATKEHISKALDDVHPTIRQNAVAHPKATHEHISKALNDKNINVRSAAIQHPNATSEHISKALDDEDYYNRIVAIRHPNATHEHISKALNDKDHDVREAAIKRKQELENKEYK